ncbi:PECTINESTERASE INHIBITOR-LIKE [Salix koriyanagi]|uniref:PECTINESTERASE INHIBITOR-LIKE n=1 Tax=Salix koriyanagi TaxID=2511006 RepID=A0A9Q0YUM3_9ROSI|nr:PECTINESTERASE INHIBITOR-LIKE [Salix koriyanagi]
MASPVRFISLALPLVVIWACFPSHIAAIRFEKKAGVALVQSLCNESQDPDFCNRTLATDPRVEAANMDGLALISISLTIDQVQTTSDSIASIRGQVSDPIGKQRIEVCQADYTDALRQFRGAFSSSDGKAYWDVIDRVRDGTNKVIDCENIYKRDPIRASPISVDNHNVIKLSELTLIIVDQILPH